MVSFAKPLDVFALSMASLIPGWPSEYKWPSGYKWPGWQSGYKCTLAYKSGRGSLIMSLGHTTKTLRTFGRALIGGTERLVFKQSPGRS